MEGELAAIYEGFARLSAVRKWSRENYEERNELIGKFFARASNLKEYSQEISGKKEYFTPKRWERHRAQQGIKRFKRKALGLCGEDTTKSLDELAELLCTVNIVNSVSEGIKLIPCLGGIGVDYGFPPYFSKRLSITEVSSFGEGKKYRIRIQN